MCATGSVEEKIEDKSFNNPNCMTNSDSLSSDPICLVLMLDILVKQLKE